MYYKGQVLPIRDYLGAGKLFVETCRPRLAHVSTSTPINEGKFSHLSSPSLGKEEMVPPSPSLLPLMDRERKMGRVSVRHE